MSTDILGIFTSAYMPSEIVERESNEIDSDVLHLVLSSLGGLSFNRGIYRTHTLDSSRVWSKITASVFPNLGPHVRCFGYDWFGRQFAVDMTPASPTEGIVLMSDVEVDTVFSTKRDIVDFHNIELVQGANKFLAVDEFEEWLKSEADKPLEWSECVGFSVPLVLGGSDDLSNRERCDMEVYWSICAQILDQTEPLPEGTRIERICAELQH